MKQHIISGSSLTALKNNSYVTLTVIDRLCKALNCTPDDIMEEMKNDQL